MSTAHDVLKKNGFHAWITPNTQDDFLRACKDGLVDVVAAYLDIGMSPNVRRPISEEPALVCAAEGGSVPTLRLLLERGADPELRDGSDETPLHTAFNWSQWDAARFLAASTKIEGVDKYGRCMLEELIRNDKSDAWRLLLELGANPAFVHRDQSPMRRAITSAKVDVVRALLAAGAPASMVCAASGATALHEAVRSQQREVQEVLLEAGAAVDVRDEYGLTPVDYALSIGNAELAECLAGRELTAHERSRGAVWRELAADNFEAALDVMEETDVAIETRNHEHETALVACARGGHLASVERLVARGARPLHRALSAAVSNGHEQVVARLLAAGAAIFDDEGECHGVSGAVWEGRAATVKLLLDACPAEQRSRFARHVFAATMQHDVALVGVFADAGVSLEYEDTSGTPLVGASGSHHDHECARTLLDRGAKVDGAQANGDTPLYTICGTYRWDETYEPTLRLLLERGARFDAINWQDDTPWTHARDEVKPILEKILVIEPLQAGVELADLVMRQSWATLPILYSALPDRFPEVLDLARAAGVALDAPAGTRATSLIDDAIEKGDAALVGELVRRGVDVNRRRAYSTLLQKAAGGDSDEVFELLLAGGADVRARDSSDQTVVHAACARPHRLAALAERGAELGGRADPPVIGAARQQDPAAIDLFIARGVPLDVYAPYGWTPLTVAIEDGHEEVALRLIAAGASPSLPSRRTGDTPLTAAAKAGNVAVVRGLLARGGDVRDKNRDGDDALTLMARRRALRHELADVFAAHGIDVAVPRPEPLDRALVTCTPAWRAVYSADESRVISAIEAGELGVNDRDPWGTTPLMVAVLRRSTPLVGKLIELGADVDLEDAAKCRAFDYGSFQRDEDIDALLKDKSKDAHPSMDRLNAMAGRALLADELNTSIERGELTRVAALLAEKKVHAFLGTGVSPIVKALDAGDEDLLELMLGLGVPLDVPDHNGRLPLEVALDAGRETAERLVAAGARTDAPGLLARLVRSDDEIVAWLLDRGADLAGRDENGDAPIHAAVEAGKLDLVKRILELDPAQIASRNGGVGFTALHCAVNYWSSCEEIARFLVERGAAVDAFDDLGRTPLHIAVNFYEADAASFLLDHHASWDIVDEAHPDCGSPRDAANAQGMSPTWPDEPVD